MRDRLRKWCENGLARITEDTEQLQMHKSIRNITRLFERIQDFEKRVIKRRGQLDRADAEAQVAALVLLARTLVPFAPHTAEELLLALRRGGRAPRRSASLAGGGRDPGFAGLRAGRLLSAAPDPASIEQRPLIDRHDVCYEWTCRAINR